MANVFSIDTFEPGTNYVIEASAGTGKTYSIVLMVKKLLKEVKGLKLDQILIVTYTEKAAGELKDRIRSSVENVDTDNAPISTFHSFCKSTMEEFPFAVNKPSILSLVDESKMVEFAKDYIRQGTILDDLTTYIRWYVQVKKKTFKEMQENAFIKLLVNSCNKYYLGPDGKEDKTIITLEKPQDKSLFGFLSAQSIDDVFKIRPEVRTHLNVLLNSQDEKSRNMAQEIIEKFRTFSFSGNTYKLSQKWPTTYAERTAYEFFSNLKALLGDFDPVKYIITEHLEAFYKAWQKEKEKNNYQTFDDMINGVRESVLQPNSLLLKKLREKYLYAIIDEFQDTNQKQFDIFSKVFLCDGHNIIVVGDPKQSIYAFQGADVEVYKKAVQQIVGNGGEMCFLEKNYRSSKEMVSSCNNLFKQDDWFGPTFTPSNYLDKAAGESAFEVTFDDEPISAFWINEEIQVSPYKYAKMVVQKIVECCTRVQKGTETVTRLRVKSKDDVKFHNVSFKDFTVLARSRTELGPIEKALTKAGIPFVRYKDNGLFQDNECAHWIALLQAIDEPDFTGERRKAFKKALFTDFFGLSLFEINKKKYNSDDIPEVECFREWKSIIHKGKYDALIDDILIRSGIVERMTNLNNIQKLNKYRQIGDYCSNFLTKKHSLSDLINNLMFLSEGGSNEDDEDGAIVEKGTDFDCVQIMTIHASKGLQFPVVISVAGVKNLPSESSFIYHDLNNGGIQTLTFKSNDFIEEEKKQEILRLFYVAYTRAQYVMMLPRYTLGKNAKVTALIYALNNYFPTTYPNDYYPIKDNGDDYDDLSKQVKDILPQETPDLKGRDQQTKDLKDLIKIKKAKESHKRSYSNLSHPAHEDKDDEYDEDSGTILDKEGVENEGLKEYDTKGMQIDVTYADEKPLDIPKNFPKGSEVGSALHEVFEKTDFKNYNKKKVKDLIKERFDANKLKLEQQFENNAWDIVDNVLKAKLPVIHGNKAIDGESFSLNTIPNEDKKPEIEFNVNLHSEKLKNYFNGFIDLLFRRGEYYSILDWKSDSLNDRDFPSYKDKDSLKNHTDNAYSIQRVLYCYFLIEWLTLKYGSDREKIFNEHFGGIYYVYLRGCNAGTFNGIYSQTWESYAELKAAYDNIVKKCIGGK